MWVKINSYSASNYLWVYDNTDSPEIRLIFANTGALSFNGYDNDAYQFQLASSAVSSGVWHHIVGTWQTNDARLYIDGVIIASDSSVNITHGNTSTTHHLAGNYSRDPTTTYINGLIDDVRTYNRVLSAAEVTQLYQSRASAAQTSNTRLTSPINSGLVGYWTLDGKDISWTTNTATDRSGNSNNGNLTNMSTTTSPTIGKIGQGLHFEGGNQYVTVPHSSSLSVTNVTVSTWFKSNMIPDSSLQTIVAKDGTWSGTGTNYQVDVRLSGKIEFAFRKSDSSGAEFRTDNPVITDTKWHYITVTYDGLAPVIYLDGTVQASTCVGGTCTNANLGTNSNTLEIGRLISGINPLKANIDDLRIYNRALSAAEILQLYRAGKYATVRGPTSPEIRADCGVFTDDGRGGTAISRGEGRESL